MSAPVYERRNGPFELYLRVRGDWHSHHQDMIPFSEKPPQSSVISPNIQVPNMQALNRTSSETNMVNVTHTANSRKNENGVDGVPENK